MIEQRNNKFCFNCGTEMFAKAEICPRCGARQANPVGGGKVSNWWYLFSFIFGVIGGVIAWVINKEKDPQKAKRFIIVGCVLPIITTLAPLIIIPLSLKGSRVKAQDAIRKSDIRQIHLAMEMYCVENDRNDANDYSCFYLQSANMPLRIGNFLNPVPQDPGKGPCSSYKWISNAGDPKRFCVYACLSDGTFFAASHKGTENLNRAPINLDCF